MIAHSQQYPDDPSDIGREWVSVFSGLFPATLSGGSGAPSHSQTFAV